MHNLWRKCRFWHAVCAAHATDDVARPGGWPSFPGFRRPPSGAPILSARKRKTRLATRPADRPVQRRVPADIEGKADRHPHRYALGGLDGPHRGDATRAFLWIVLFDIARICVHGYCLIFQHDADPARQNQLCFRELSLDLSQGPVVRRYHNHAIESC